MDRDQTLGRDDLEEANPHVVQDAEPLGLGLEARRICLLGEFLSAEPEIVPCDDLLPDESAHEVARRGLALGDKPLACRRHLAERPDLILGIADGGIRVEPRLEGPLRAASTCAAACLRVGFLTSAIRSKSASPGRPTEPEAGVVGLEMVGAAIDSDRAGDDGTFTGSAVP